VKKFEARYQKGVLVFYFSLKIFKFNTQKLELKTYITDNLELSTSGSACWFKVQARVRFEGYRIKKSAVSYNAVCVEVEIEL
jgi:hypothetical protein